MKILSWGHCVIAGKKVSIFLFIKKEMCEIILIKKMTKESQMLNAH